MHTSARVARCRPPPLATHSGADTLQTRARPAGTRPLYSLQEAENFLSATTTSASTTQVASRAAMTIAAMAPGPSEPAKTGSRVSLGPAHPLPSPLPPVPPAPRPAAYRRCGPDAPVRCCPRGSAGRWRPGDPWPRAPGLRWCSPRGLLRRAAQQARSTAWVQAPAGPRLQGQGQALRPRLQAHRDVSPPPDRWHCVWGPWSSVLLQTSCVIGERTKAERPQVTPEPHCLQAHMKTGRWGQGLG